MFCVRLIAEFKACHRWDNMMAFLPMMAAAFAPLHCSQLIVCWLGWLLNPVDLPLIRPLFLVLSEK